MVLNTGISNGVQLAYPRDVAGASSRTHTRMTRPRIDPRCLHLLSLCNRGSWSMIWRAHILIATRSIRRVPTQLIEKGQICLLSSSNKYVVVFKISTHTIVERIADTWEFYRLVVQSEVLVVLFHIALWPYRWNFSYWE